MQQDDIIAILKDFFHEYLEIPPTNITMDTSLVEINVDSLDLIKLALACESRFQIRIDTEDLAGIVTFGNIVERVEKKIQVA